LRTSVIITCLLLACTFVRSGLAQQYPSRHFNTLDGLPNNAIRSLYLDSRGLLWIGTENGLSKMENNTFQNFDETDGLAFNSCWAIIEDPLGQMWFGSYGGGISYFDGRFFHALDSGDGLINDFIRSLYFFDDKIWVGTINGLSAIDIQTKEITSFESSLSDSPQAYISGFFVDEGVLHYTTHGIGIYRVEPEVNGSFLVKKVNDHKLIVYSQHIGERIYLSNKEEVQIMAPKDLIAGKEVGKGFGHSHLWDYEQDREGIVYAAAWGIYTKDGGVYQLDGEHMVDRSEAFGIDSQVILALAYDEKKDVLYAGSNDKGLYAVRLSESILYEQFGERSVMGFAHILDQTAILHHQGLSILGADGKETVRVGLADFKSMENAYLQKNRNNLPQHQDGFFELNFELPAADLEFYEIHSTDSSLWISSNLGIFELDVQGEFITYLPVHTYVMGFTPDGRLIESNPYHGLRLYDDPARMKYTYYSDTLSYTPIFLSQIVTSSHKTYFASVFRGLYEWKDGQFLNYSDQKLWGELKIKALHLLDEHTLVIGAEFGDFYIADDREDFKIIETIRDEDIEGTSVQFLEAWNGRLLIGTEKGLSVYHQGNIRFYDEEQGFESKIFQAAKVIGDELWLGTSVGYYRVNLPELLKQKDFPLDLVITDLEVNHQPVSQEAFSWFSLQKRELELSHKQNTIYLTFQPRGHQFPDKLSYRYRLQEDAVWSPVSQETTLALPLLPSGLYPVEIEVSDSHTGVSRIFPLLTIFIKTPFYLKPLFWAGMFAVFVAMSWLLYKARIRHLHRQEKARAANIRRMAETKLEALRSQMNPHFIFNAITSIQYFILKKDTDGALGFLNKFSTMIRSTLDNSSKQRITLTEEMNYLKSYFAIENSRMDNRVRLDLHIDPQLDPKEITVPPMLLQPFVENAFVHAFTESHSDPVIRIEFKKGEERQLHCFIKDNGVGFQDQPKTKIHESKGKKLVEERLRLMEGAVEEPLLVLHGRSGTTVCLVIPLEEKSEEAVAH
jgi:hypothetical protein